MMGGMADAHHGSTHRPGRATGVAVGVLVVVTVALYAQVVTFDFIRFDDEGYVTSNEHVQAGLSAASIRWALTSTAMSNWHPLTWLSYMLDVELFGVHAGGHHAVNALFHLANTLLLFGLLRAMTGAVWRPAVVAALFAWHPQHVESVAWVAERKDVLSACMGLSSLWAYAVYARSGRWRWLAASAVLMALGLTAKPMLVTLPFVMLLLDIWPLKRTAGGDRWRRWLRLTIEKAPMFALTAASCAITMIMQQAAMSHSVALHERAANAAVSYVRYLAHTFWPADLVLLYPHPYLYEGAGWSPWQIAGSAAVLVIITAGVLIMRRRSYLLVGWVWFLGMLVPVIGLVQVGMQAMADRYSYLPLIGLFIALTWAGGDLILWLEQRYRSARATAAMRITATVLVSALLAACAALGYRQIGYWRDRTVLYEHTIAAYPANPTIHVNLGEVYQAARNYDRAIEHYQSALQYAPDHAIARYNLGAALALADRPADAMASFEQACMLEPMWHKPYASAAWLAATHPDDSVRDAALALRLAGEADRLTHHRDPSILDTLAAAYAANGRFDEAVATLDDAIKLTRQQPGRESLVTTLTRRRQLYRNGRPYIEADSDQQTPPP